MRNYDYKKAIEIIEQEKENLNSVYLGMISNWRWTSEMVWCKNSYLINLKKKPKILGIGGSTRDKPTLKLCYKNGDFAYIDCYIEDGKFIGFTIK